MNNIIHHVSEWVCLTSLLLVLFPAAADSVNCKYFETCCIINTQLLYNEEASSSD